MRQSIAPRTIGVATNGGQRYRRVGNRSAATNLHDGFDRGGEPTVRDAPLSSP
jgi:hypothetical protein